MNGPGNWDDAWEQSTKSSTTCSSWQQPWSSEKKQSWQPEKSWGWGQTKNWDNEEHKGQRNEVEQLKTQVAHLQTQMERQSNQINELQSLVKQMQDKEAASIHAEKLQQIQVFQSQVSRTAIVQAQQSQLEDPWASFSRCTWHGDGDSPFSPLSPLAFDHAENSNILVPSLLQSINENMKNARFGSWLEHVPWNVPFFAQSLLFLFYPIEEKIQ